MAGEKVSADRIHGLRRQNFLEFIELLSEIDCNEKLFPKRCRTCGKSFQSLSEYLCGTKPKGHSLENYRQVMRKPFTMIYRHCLCGNTLVVTLTADIFPALDLFWSMIEEEAAESGKSVQTVVSEFIKEWETHMLGHKSCL